MADTERPNNVLPSTTARLPSSLTRRIAQARDSVRTTKVQGSTGNTYLVTQDVDRNLWTCTCKAFEYGHGPCKHIKMVKEGRADGVAGDDCEQHLAEGE